MKGWLGTKRKSLKFASKKEAKREMFKRIISSFPEKRLILEEQYKRDVWDLSFIFADVKVVFFKDGGVMMDAIEK